MGDGNGYFGEGMHHAHHGWWGGPLHLIVFLVILGVLVAGAVWLVRRVSGGGFVAVHQVGVPAPVLTGSDPAVAALRLRYASGDVSRAEFQRTMADLTGVATPLADGHGEGEEAAPTQS